MVEGSFAAATSAFVTEMTAWALVLVVQNFAEEEMPVQMPPRGIAPGNVIVVAAVQTDLLMSATAYYLAAVAMLGVDVRSADSERVLHVTREDYDALVKFVRDGDDDGGDDQLAGCGDLPLADQGSTCLLRS